MQSLNLLPLHKHGQHDNVGETAVQPRSGSPLNSLSPSTDYIAEPEKHVPQRPTDETLLIAFTSPLDADNPKDWPMLKKWIVTGVLSASGFNRIMVSTIMAPVLTSIALDLNMTYLESVMAMSVYLLATAFGPLIMGPLSEIYGRKPILHASNIWFLAWNIACGSSNSGALLITSRFMAGFGASAIYALGSGVLGDVWRPEQRGRSIALYLLIPLLGVAVGPMIGGFIAGGTTWRWIFWSTSIVQAVMNVASFLTFRETHAPTILRERAAHFRKITGNDAFYTIEERLEAGRSVTWVLRKSLSRPLRLLMFHPIIQIQACISGLSYGMLYLVISTFSDLWLTQYNDPLSISGLHYIAICLGEALGAQIGGPLLDLVSCKLTAHNNGVMLPEFHIPLMVPAAVITPLSFLMYGWAADYALPWPVVDAGVLILSFSMQASGQALQAYVIDSYPGHTASASAASQLLRSLAAFGFPLFAPRMYEVLGYGWGNSLLAFVGLWVLAPAPLVVWRYGARMRARNVDSY